MCKPFGTWIVSSKPASTATTGPRRRGWPSTTIASCWRRIGDCRRRRLCRARRLPMHDIPPRPPVCEKSTPQERLMNCCDRSDHRHDASQALACVGDDAVDYMMWSKQIENGHFQNPEFYFKKPL